VWVPFTSEAKEAVAHYDELLREMKLAIQECGRKLGSHLRARAHAPREEMRRSLFEKYIPEVAEAIAAILALPIEKTKQPFYRALPTFVGGAEEAPDKEPPPSSGNGGAAPPPPAKSAAKSGKKGADAPPQPAPARRGGKGKKGGDQLSLM
jgi:hypothetical protein